MRVHHHPPNNTNENTNLVPRSAWNDTPAAPRPTDPFRWAWPGWLPNGYLTILSSEPGVGKSFLALRIAASFLDKRPWPDGAPFAARTRKILRCESETGRFPNFFFPCCTPCDATRCAVRCPTRGRR